MLIFDTMKVLFNCVLIAYITFPLSLHCCFSFLSFYVLSLFILHTFYISHIFKIYLSIFLSLPLSILSLAIYLSLSICMLFNLIVIGTIKCILNSVKNEKVGFMKNFYTCLSWHSVSLFTYCNFRWNYFWDFTGHNG